MTKKENKKIVVNENEESYNEGRYLRKIQYLRLQNVLTVSLPTEQTSKLGIKKGDYVKVTNNGHNKITLEKIDI